ncbi:hypothetical protein QQ045_009826 [Rhodiola kirilowii]
MKEHMEVEGCEPRNIETLAVAANDGAVLPPVGPNESGIGYPYAPENWPKPGDNWRWKEAYLLGHRFSANDGMQKLRGIFDSVYEPELEKFRTWA